jgi:predicted ribosomally synthesized peptide with SipW-like signal peptide
MNIGMRKIMVYKKTSLIMMMISLIVILGVAGTYASFTGGKSVSNMLEAGTVIAVIHENGVPTGGLTFEDVDKGITYEKEVTIQNTGTAPAYIRVNLIPSWEKDGQLIPNNNVVYGGLNTVDWVFRPEDGYYYYRKVVNPEELTEPLFESVTIDPNVVGINNHNYEGATLKLSILAEIVQEANDAASSVWGFNPTTL